MHGPQAARDREFQADASAYEIPKAQASNKPATDVLVDTLTYLDLKPDAIIAFQNLLSKNAHFHEEDIVTAARSLPISRALLARTPEQISELPEDLQDKRHELEVAGIQAALALIGRTDRSLAVDVLRIALADKSTRSEAIFDSLSIRLKKAYAGMMGNVELPVRDLLASVRAGTASEANADFLRGFFWSLSFSTNSDSAKTQEANAASPFQRITSEGIKLGRDSEDFLLNLCPKDSAPPLPASKNNPEIKIALKEGLKRRTKYERLLEIIDYSESLTATDVLRIVQSLKGKKELDLPTPKLLICEELGIATNKEELAPYAAIEIAYRAVRKLDPSTLSHDLHSEIFVRTDKLIEELGQSRLCSLSSYLFGYITFTAPAWGLAALFNNIPCYVLAAAWTLIMTKCGYDMWNGYDMPNGEHEDGAVEINLKTEQKFGPAKDKITAMFDAISKAKREQMLQVSKNHQAV